MKTGAENRMESNQRNMQEVTVTYLRPCQISAMNIIGKMLEKWDKVFKNRPTKSFKGCFPQILLGPFLNILSQMFNISYFSKKLHYRLF